MNADLSASTWEDLHGRSARELYASVPAFAKCGAEPAIAALTVAMTFAQTAITARRSENSVAAHVVIGPKPDADPAILGLARHMGAAITGSACHARNATPFDPGTWLEQAGYIGLLTRAVKAGASATYRQFSVAFRPRTNSSDASRASAGCFRRPRRASSGSTDPLIHCGRPSPVAFHDTIRNCDDAVHAARCRSAPRRNSMSTHPPFRKVFDGVATREEMFRLFNHHRDDPDVDPLSGKPYSSEWFEIEAAQYHFMLGLLPPLFQRSGMFGLSEYKAGNVTSVFFAIRIRGRERFFHGFCDLGDRQCPDKMCAAIIAHETGAADSMTREEKLEAIWSATHPDFKGIAGKSDPGDWPAEHHGKRFVLVRGGPDRVLKLLEDLSDEEIDIRMAAIRAHRANRGGGSDADPS